MKTFFIAILLLFTFTSKCQKSAIIIDSIDLQPKIFSKSLIWVSENWKNPKEVIQMEDEKSGIIILNGSIGGTTLARISIRIIDNSAKIEFTDVSMRFNTIDFFMEDTDKTKKLKGKWRKLYEDWRSFVLLSEDDYIQSYKKILLADIKNL